MKSNYSTPWLCIAAAHLLLLLVVAVAAADTITKGLS